MPYSIDDETPTPALADCDDPVSRLLLSRRRLDDGFRVAATAVQRYSDVMWKIVENNPPGFLNGVEEEELL